MKKLVVRLVLLPILLIVAVFALSNREPTQLSLWPLPWEIEAPMFLVLLATLLTGFLIGGSLAWGGGRQHRSAARAHRRNNERLQRQLDEMKTRQPVVVASVPQVMPPDRAIVQAPPSYTPINRSR